MQRPQDPAISAIGYGASDPGGLNTDR